MKYKVVIRESYREMEFEFNDYEEASIFIGTALAHSKGYNATISIIDEVEEDNEVDDGR